MKHNYLTRLTALLLTLAMMLSTLPATALAAEVEPVEPEQELADMVEEALPEELDNDDLTDGQEDSHLPPEETSEVPGTEDETPVPDETDTAGEWVPVPDTSDASNGLLDIEYFITEVDEEAVRSDPMASAEQTFSDLDAALAYIREEMKARKETVNVRVSESIFYALLDNGWGLIFAHTGDPTEGDYLVSAVGGWSCSSQSQSDGSVIFSYQFTYHDNAALEQQATGVATALAQSLELNSTSLTPQEKLRRIYAYMVDEDNLQYDYDTYYGNASDGSGYTGAGALVNHKAVCQGYASMFYRMSLMAGIDCRIVSSSSLNHAWVIAQVGSLYYLLDPTWDSSREESDWKYYLRGELGFYDHDNEDDNFCLDVAFRSAYPLADFDIDQHTEDLHAENYGTAPAFTLIGTNGEIFSTAANGRAKMLVFIQEWCNISSHLVQSLTDKSYPGVDIFYICMCESPNQKHEYLNMIGTDDFPTTNNPGHYTFVPSFFRDFPRQLYTLGKQTGILKYTDDGGFLYGFPTVFLVNAENQLIYGKSGGGLPSDSYMAAFMVNENAPAAPEPVVYDADAVGLYGDNAVWRYKSEGTLTIGGSGPLWSCGANYGIVYGNEEINFSDVRSVIVEPGITDIGERAFSGYTGLTSVTIGNGVTSIGEWAFSGCTGLTSIAIPASVTSIGAGAFSGCTGLTKINIGNGVINIGESAFGYCTGLTSVTIGNGVTSIGEWAFYDCTGLTSITIPDSVTSIDEGAFYDCTGLTAVTIGNGVTSIGEWAFSGCTGLTSITIPKSVTSIGENAFMHCDNLTFQVSAGSYGERYAKENGFPYRITGARQSLSKATITVSAQTYTGKALTPAVTVKLNGKTLKKGTDFTVSYKNNTNAGTATVTVTGKGNYTGSKSATFQINKAAQTLTASAPSTVLVGKTVKVTAKGVGKLSYKSSNTKIATVSTTGVVTGKAAGTVTITVTAAGDDNRKAASKTVTINVQFANPKITKVENTGKGVKVTWTKQTGVAACRVFYKIGKGKWTKAGDSTGTTLTWSGAKNGTAYSFTVRAIAKVGSTTYTSGYDATGTSLSFVAAPTLSKLTNSKAGTMTATWGKVSGVGGYQIQYSLNKSFSGAKMVKAKASAVSAIITKLTRNKTYYVRMRSYATISGKTVYSPWSSVKTLKITR